MIRSLPTGLFFFASLFCWVACPSLPGATAPLASGFYVVGEASTIDSEWEADAARKALEAGLSATAADIFQSLIENESLAGAANEAIKFDYVAALIAQSRYKAASEMLSNTRASDDFARKRLYRACITYGETSNPDFEAIAGELSGIEPEALSTLDLPWFFLLEGIIADARGNSNEAEKHFKVAESSAASRMQVALFSSLVLRQKILTSSTSESLLVEVREQFEALAGQSAAFPFLREYVVLLHRTGRDAEAISLLDTELARVGAGYSIDERATLLLLKGLILGPDSSAGWSSLKELVRAGVDSEATVIALQVLGATRGRQADLMVLLSDIISRPEPHPLVAQLHYMRCQLALANPETTALAEADARYLLEQFPGLSEIGSVYQLLAYAALQREPPRYRVAANYLLELRDQSSAPEEIVRLNRLIGDCYFLNRDYANAVDFYDSANPANPNVLLRLVVSQLRSNKLEAALASVDRADFDDQSGDAARWRAEWNIALALQAQGEAARALKRLRLLVDRDNSSIPALLDLRLRWLEAYISLQLDQTSGISDQIEVLLTRINSMPEDALGPDESSRLTSELLLLQAESKIALDDVESAFGLIAKIRTEFRQNIAAQRTYFTEAAYRAAVKDFRSAKQVLKSFTQDYPDSHLIPQALFEAALHAQKQGPEHYAEAVVLLDRLVRNYPGNALTYHAGIKQGDLLRLMNNFAGAQLIYENLINRFPSHRLRYVAELSQADCMAAVAQGEDSQFREAVTVLERLVDQPDLPVEVQIEAGYKWGNIVERNEDLAGAKTVYGLVTSRYLFDPQTATGLSSVGRYWLSKTIFSLCDLLESERDYNEAGKLYRKLVAFDLPGRSLALSRIDQLQLADSL